MLALTGIELLVTMLSFIIPAHNEELWIAKCLGSIRSAMEKLAEPYEVIVVNDASTDSTPAIAEQIFHEWQNTTNDQRLTTNALTSARTLPVEHRHIAAVRNAGVRAS